MLIRRQYETFSYLPPLSAEQIAKQVNYVIQNGWTPALEFADPAQSFVSNENCVRFGPVASVRCSATFSLSHVPGQSLIPLSRLLTAAQNYYDNRYWTMFKLPMFGCTDPIQVLREVANCQRMFPRAYIRLIAYDNLKQVQCMGFLVQRPAGATEYCDVAKRSVR